MKNKVVLFDWNGLIDRNIIVNHHMIDYWNTILNLSEEGLTTEEIEQALYKMYSKGHILNTMDMWVYNENVNHIKEILAEFKIKANFDRITKASKNLYCLSTLRPFNQDMILKLLSLKDKCEIGLLANCNQFDLIALDSSLDRSQLNYSFISCLMHYRMASARFYFKIQERLCRPLKDIMFITMDTKHAEKAKAVGWRVHLIGQDVSASELDEFIDSFLSE